MDTFPPPSWLTEAAAAVWQSTVNTMASAGTLDSAVLPLINRYAVTVDRWHQAEAALTLEGIMTVALRSGVRQVNPWLSISRVAAAQSAKLETELGLSPARRARATRAKNALLADGSPAPLSALDRMLEEQEARLNNRQ